MLISLLLDLPGKVTSFYRSLKYPPPLLRFEALKLDQGGITTLPLVTLRGGSSLSWNAPFEIHNSGASNVTITRVVAEFDSVRVNLPDEQVSNGVLQLVQEPTEGQLFDSYQTYADFRKKVKETPLQQLPVTIKAGDRKYIELFIALELLLNDRGVRIRDEPTLYRVVRTALGSQEQVDAQPHSIRISFTTTLYYADGGSLRQRHKDVGVWVGKARPDKESGGSPGLVP